MFGLGVEVFEFVEDEDLVVVLKVDKLVLVVVEMDNLVLWFVFMGINGFIFCGERLVRLGVLNRRKVEWYWSKDV